MKAVADPLRDAPNAANSIFRSNQIAEALILAILFAVPVLICFHATIVIDPDVWWHLRTGQWIIQHHAVPHTDPFTSFGAGKPWQAYSWLFEIILLRCFEHLGLVGIVVYTAGMVLAITVSIYALVRRLQPDFSATVLLTLVVYLGLIRLYTPRPWLFTILFFTLELNILLHARSTGKTRALFLLPLIFVLWANTHIQFVDGLLILVFAFAESVASRWWPMVETRLSAAWAGGVFCACVLATLLNPYGWTIYKIAHDLATQAGALDNISEMQAIPFRGLPDYCILLLALAAAAALAASCASTWNDVDRRRFPAFEAALLIFAALISFRSLRDMWATAIVAGAILASRFTAGERQRHPAGGFAVPVIVAALGLILFAGVRLMHVNNDHLRSELVETMPVRAVDFVRQQRYPGPLYNTFDWGGYLIWNLRLPVSIDGRSAFAGDNRMNRSIATWSGAPDWSSDPDLKAAALVIGPVNAPLTQLLRTDGRFHLAYEDKMAVVFTRNSNAR